MLKPIKNPSDKLVMAGFIVALSTISIYISTILPTGKLFFYALSTMFPAIILKDHQVSLSMVTYIASSIIAIIIIPNKISLIPYLIFFGYYGLIKYFIEKLNNIFFELSLKIIVFNIGIYIIFIIIRFIMPDLISGFKYPLNLIFLIAQILFIVYDYSYSMMISYLKNLKINNK